MKRTILGSLVSLALLGLAGTALAQQGPVKVGLIYPLSGGSGPAAQTNVKAIQSMAAMINDDGGVLGRKIEFVIRDDEGTPAVGVAKANEIVAENVAVVLEGWNSPVVLAMQPIFTRANILDITSHGQADAILSGTGNPLAIKLNSSGADTGEATAAFIKKKGYKRLAFMVQNDVYGNGAAQALVDGLKKLNVAYTLVSEQKFPMSKLDFRGELTSIREANPDAVLFWNASSSTGVPTTLQQFKQARINAPIIAGAGVATENTIEQTGPDANGMFSTDFYFSDIPPFDKIPQNARFNARVKQMHGIKPDKFMALGALSLQIWAKAANETKSLSKDVIAKRIRGGVIKDTIIGDAQFSANGQLQAKFYDYTVTNGKVTIIP
jgi:branched-chain amino acid transport system substrate-binding protein